MNEQLKAIKKLYEDAKTLHLIHSGRKLLKHDYDTFLEESESIE